MTVGIRRNLRKQATDEGLELDSSPIKTSTLMAGENKQPLTQVMMLLKHSTVVNWDGMC